MMQMLGLRGSSAKGAESSPQSISPRPSSTSPVAVGTGRPLRLVYCDEKGQFQMDPEAVSTLQLVKEPLGVVSVCGRARQGKSFILNQLLGRSSGFKVASTHRPCTKGLWMWSAPLKRTALDGTNYHLLLLDSEGIDAFDQTGTYSTQIFSLAVLLSSMFIYNQMGGIDETALDRLSLVTEMTKHIRVRASGGKTTASELGQFSPVFVWLLRDFYLDLAEDTRKITPRDYLELALTAVQGGGKDIIAKNEIRESIRALFPDRECFTLVRPLNNEKDLQHLDQMPLDRLRPEFRFGLDALTKFVFERTKPKQVDATVMTGPILAGITQSFLDAINNGAVPTISSSWQSVEDAECRRAYDAATEAYMSAFDRSRPPEEGLLREAHENAVQKSLNVFNSVAIGAGAARQKYAMTLQNFQRKAFEDYKKNAFMEADLRCSNFIQMMEKKLRATCNESNAKPDTVINVLSDLLSEYKKSSYGPAMWQKLATFLHQSFEGPILDFVKKQLDKINSEKATLMLKCRTSEDKMELLSKQLEAYEKQRVDYLRRYEDAVSDKKKIVDDYTTRLSNLQGKCSSLEERCLSLMKALDSAKQESSESKRKLEQSSVNQKSEEDKMKAEILSLQTWNSSIEARLAAAREQANSAQEEAAEWRRKYDVSVRESKAALDKSATAHERTNKLMQQREDAQRAEFHAILAEKEEEIKEKCGKVDQAEHKLTSLSLDLKATESKLASYEVECSALKREIKELHERLDSISSTAQSYEHEARILEKEKINLEQKYQLELKRFDEASERCAAAVKEAKHAVEMADNARAEAAAAQKEQSEAQRMAVERLTLIEKAERQVETLERHKADLMEEIVALRVSEMDSNSKVALLERQVEEREREIERLLKSTSEQRANTVQVLEGLLASERAAHAEANSRADMLSLQLQSTQGKLDALQQELTSVRLNETALDSKLKTASHGKRYWADEHQGLESMMDVDEHATRGWKRSRSTTSPVKTLVHDGGSVFQGEGNEEDSGPQLETGDYTRFTMQKLKQEITKHGFGAELLKLRNPPKKEVLALYEKHILKK